MFFNTSEISVSEERDGILWDMRATSSYIKIMTLLARVIDLTLYRYFRLIA
jgi:hypothetical protein